MPNYDLALHLIQPSETRQLHEAPFAVIMFQETIVKTKHDLSSLRHNANLKTKIKTESHCNQTGERT